MHTCCVLPSLTSVLTPEAEISYLNFTLLYSDGYSVSPKYDTGVFCPALRLSVWSIKARGEEKKNIMHLKKNVK